MRGPGSQKVSSPHGGGHIGPLRISLGGGSPVSRRPRPPAAVLAAGFLVLIAIGTALLLLPVSSRDGSWADPVTALFTATSAVCVTGLSVVDTADHWSPFGQVVILVLIQLGGLGFMTGTTLVLFARVSRRTALRDRILAQETVGIRDLGSVRRTIRRVAAFSFATEASGAVVLTTLFVARGSEPGQAAWYGLFHAVSAFNNAGFDVLGGFRSLTGYARDPLILVAIAALVIVGGLGYAILADVVTVRRWNRLALETKLVLLATAGLLLAGTVLFGLFEWTNPATLGALPPADRVVNAGFQSVVLRTAGFAAIPTGSLQMESLFLAIGLMFIGAASGSTGGGIKVNTFAVLLLTIVSTVRGRETVEGFGRHLPQQLVNRALSVGVLSMAAVFAVALALTAQTGLSFTSTLFEATSAVATVGVSTGITPGLADASLLLLSLAMFVGRLGPLTLVLALTAREQPRSFSYPVETVRIG